MFLKKIKMQNFHSLAIKLRGWPGRGSRARTTNGLCMWIVVLLLSSCTVALHPCLNGIPHGMPEPTIDVRICPCHAWNSTLVPTGSSFSRLVWRGDFRFPQCTGRTCQLGHSNMLHLPLVRQSEGNPAQNYM
jgi:hypothetical protein